MSNSFLGVAFFLVYYGYSSYPSEQSIMVRFKDEGARHKVKIDKKAPVGPEVVTPSGSRLMRKQRASGTWRGLFVFVVIVLFLAIGWFTARAVMVGMDVAGSGGFWAGLFGGSATRLVGEDDGRVNVLLLGNPGGGDKVDGPYLTDTLMVASYGVEAKALHLFSIPRDLYVDVGGYGMTKINAVYKIGESEFSDGPGTILDTIEPLLGLSIPYYVKVDFNGFKQIVDEMGGVTVEVTKDLYDPYYPTEDKGYQTLDIKAGVYTMDGDMALKYVRSRRTTSDFDRAKRQQQVLVALRDKAMNLELLTAPTKILALQDALQDHFSTNLTQAEAKRAFQLLAELDASQVVNKVFDDSPAGLLYGTKVDDIFVLKPVEDDYGKLAEFVELALTQPESVETTDLPPLKVEVLNGTLITGLAGRVAEKLEEAGFEVVKIGNNPTRGFDESVVYDSDDGKRFSDVKRLADIVGATIGTETVDLTSADVRLVVGESAAD